MKPTTIRLSGMMFLQFFIWGAWYVTVGNYMMSHGMFDQVSWAYTVGPIAALISPFFLGMIADRYFSTERVLMVLHILGALAMFAAPFAATISPFWFIAALLLHMLCYMPTLGLVNTLAFHNIENQEKEFPIIRVFGTIGWIAASLVVSSLFKADFSATQFYITGVASILLGLYSFTLPHTPPPAKGKAFSAREVLGLDALALMKEFPFAVFIASSFLICIPLAAYFAFTPIFVGKVGFEEPASTMSLGQVSEIFFMLAMPLFFARLGVKGMLAVGMLAWVIRYGLFAGADDGNIQWLVLGGILLHGICYDFFFVTGFIYTDKKCSKELRGQAQGLLVLVTQGLGLGIGAQIMGRVVGANTPPEAKALNGQSTELAREAFTTTDESVRASLMEQADALSAQASQLIDWQRIWLIPCVMAAVVLVAFVLVFRDRVQKNTTEGEVAQAATQDELP